MSTQAPHRGALILVLGILGLLVCQVLSFFAWIMGKGDLQRMDAGEMDSDGRGLTQAGMICGIVGVALLAIGILIFVVMMVFGLAAGAAGAAGA